MNIYIYIYIKILACMQHLHVINMFWPWVPGWLPGLRGKWSHRQRWEPCVIGLFWFAPGPWALGWPLGLGGWGGFVLVCPWALAPWARRWRFPDSKNRFGGPERPDGISKRSWRLEVSLGDPCAPLGVLGKGLGMQNGSYS